MIGFTKLLCGTATVSDILAGSKEPGMLQFNTLIAPIVVLSITNRCNLSCEHCYIEALDKKYKDELTTDEARGLIDDLSEMGVPVLLFSGGEPLIREDIFELGSYARERGIRIVISSNGTLITKELAVRIKETGFGYVGVSIDGLSRTHDRFRGIPGSFDMAINGLRVLRQEGVRVGVRFTINKHNYRELPQIIDLVVKENIPRFCMYHLVYAGRGREMVKQDTINEDRLRYIEFLCQKALELYWAGVETEILTTDNHADGVVILDYIAKNHPQRRNEIIELLKRRGGCSAGVKIANIDPKGNVHPCQFWQDLSLGNIREERFSQIWNNPANEFLDKLRNKEKYLTGRCGQCNYKDICGGCRIRARVIHGKIWAEDPSCYLMKEDR